MRTRLSAIRRPEGELTPVNYEGEPIKEIELDTILHDAQTFAERQIKVALKPNTVERQREKLYWAIEDLHRSMPQAVYKNTAYRVPNDAHVEGTRIGMLVTHVAIIRALSKLAEERPEFSDTIHGYIVNHVLDQSRFEPEAIGLPKALVHEAAQRALAAAEKIVASKRPNPFLERHLSDAVQACGRLVAHLERQQPAAGK
jgi:hypothetical protein